MSRGELSGRSMVSRGLSVLTAAPLALLLLAVPIAIVAAAVAYFTAGAAGVALGGVVRALRVSLTTATVATLLGALSGTPLALVVVRRRSRAGRSALTVLVSLPLVLPPAAAGLGLLLALGPASPLGGAIDRIGLRLAFSPAAVVIAQLFVASPLFLAQAIRGFSVAEATLRDLAALDGARDLRYLVGVLVPAAAPQLTIGLVTMWARALGEFGATMIFAGNLPGRTRTLPLELYVGLQSGLGAALVAATILLAVAASVVAVVSIARQPDTPSASRSHDPAVIPRRA